LRVDRADIGSRYCAGASRWPVYKALIAPSSRIGADFRLPFMLLCGIMIGRITPTKRIANLDISARLSQATFPYEPMNGLHTLGPVTPTAGNSAPLKSPAYCAAAKLRLAVVPAICGRRCEACSLRN